MTATLTLEAIQDCSDSEREQLIRSATSITADAAEYLGAANEYLPLDNIRELSVEVARGLAKTHRHLCLDRLPSITLDLATALAHRPENSQSLSLKGVTNITPDVARVLASSTVTQLELGLTSLPVDVATELGRCRCSYLYLGHLSAISDEAAAAYTDASVSVEKSRRGGELNLDGLRTISDRVAAALAKVSPNADYGTIWLNGLTELSDKAAKHLSRLQKNLKISLNGLQNLSQAACVAVTKRVDTSHASVDPMRPGWESEHEVARLFFRLLFRDRQEKRANNVERFVTASTGRETVDACVAAIDADVNSRELSHLGDCVVLSVAAAVRLSTRKAPIKCPGFLGFYDSQHHQQEWRDIGDAVVRYLQKVKGHGPRCASLGGLLIELMLSSEQPQAMAQLLRVAREIKNRDTARWIESRVAWTTEELGTTPEALEDAAIETLGFGNAPTAPKAQVKKSRQPVRRPSKDDSSTPPKSAPNHESPRCQATLPPKEIQTLLRSKTIKGVQAGLSAVRAADDRLSLVSQVFTPGILKSLLVFGEKAKAEQDVWAPVAEVVLPNRELHQTFIDLAEERFLKTRKKASYANWGQYRGLYHALEPSVRENFLKICCDGKQTSEPRLRAVDLVDVTGDDLIAVGRSPVTRAQWELVVGNRPWLYDDDGTKSDGDARDGDGELPVTNVSWYDADYFCEALTRLEKESGLIRKDQVYRRPSYQELARAVRGGPEGSFFLCNNLSEMLGDTPEYSDNPYECPHSIFGHSDLGFRVLLSD